MSKEKIVRSKPHMNVGLIGHKMHGKTTLMSAITKVLSAEGNAKYMKTGELDRCLEEIERRTTVYNKYAEIETMSRHYALIDVPGHADYTKTSVAGMSEMDGAIVVVAATDGPMPQTREHILLARQMAVSQLIVFMSKCDQVDDEELLELVTLEIRELLSTYDFPGDDTPVIMGSAFKVLETEKISDFEGTQKIKDLLNAMDGYFCDPERSSDDPFFMPASHTYVRSSDLVACGQIKSGIINLKDEVDIFNGCKDTVQKSVVLGIEIFNKSCDSAQPGDLVGLLLKDVNKSDVKRGLEIYKQNSHAQTVPSVTCEVYILAKEEGGRHTPFRNGYNVVMHMYTSSYEVTIDILGAELIFPGDNCQLRLKFRNPVSCSSGRRFALREGGRTVGAGLIISVME